MKKKHINLLINREDYQKYENYFEKLKLSAAILTVILFVVFLSFFMILNKKSSLFEETNQQKKTYLQLLTSKKGDEAKINYIQKKYADLETFIKDDASSSTYYQLLSEAIKDSSQSANLKSFEVDKKRDTSFTISFSDFDRLMDFLKFAESKTFINNFEIITLKSFSIAGDEENNQNYELIFNGTFTPVKYDLINEK